MKGYWEYLKTKQGSFRLTGDILMLAGIMYLSWSPLRIISYFWLDTVIMGIFLSYFVTRQFETNIIFMLPGIFLIGAVMFGFYIEIYKSFHSIYVNSRHFVIPDNLFDEFKPFYQTSAILISIVCGHFFDCRYFTRLIKGDSKTSVNYIFVFIGRFLSIGGAMISMEMMKEFFTSNLKTAVPMAILIALKQYLEFIIYQAYNKKVITPGEEKMPMI